MPASMNYYQKNLNASKLQKCYEVAPPRIQQLLTAEIDFILSKISTDDNALHPTGVLARLRHYPRLKKFAIFAASCSLENV